MISNKAATEKALLRPIAYLFGATLKPWVRTLDARVADYSQDTDPATIGYGGPAIFLLWHEYILLPVAERRNLGITLLIGPHRDADWLDWIARDFGFNTVRGSSTKGGIKAILQFRKEHPSTSLVVTPDGPKGPRRVLSPGCIQLSGLLQMPVIPVGIGFHRPIRAKTWDNFAIPRPGSRARVVLGDRIQIPRGLNETQLEAHRLWIEEILHQIGRAHV